MRPVTAATGVTASSPRVRDRHPCRHAGRHRTHRKSEGGVPSRGGGGDVGIRGSPRLRRRRQESRPEPGGYAGSRWVCLVELGGPEDTALVVLDEAEQGARATLLGFSRGGLEGPPPAAPIVDAFMPVRHGGSYLDFHLPLCRGTSVAGRARHARRSSVHPHTYATNRREKTRTGREEDEGLPGCRDARKRAPRPLAPRAGPRSSVGRRGRSRTDGA